MIRDHISKRFPGEQSQVLALRERLTAACEMFVSSGRADSKFLTELTSGVEQKFWACISEALIADRLREKAFPPRIHVGEGPHFLVADGPRKIWIEAVCPEPNNVSNDWLEPKSGKCIDFPHVDILLRWTSAIKVKAERLVGDSRGKITGYLKDGVVGADDAYVIAVNGARMRSGPFPALIGISQFPFAAEAVFPIGPYQLRIDRETLKTVDTGHQHRPFVKNRNGSDVPAYTFLDPAFEPISAIWAVDLNGAAAWGGPEPMLVIHNPNARNPIPVGFLPADFEYIVRSEGDNFVLEKHARD